MLIYLLRYLRLTKSIFELEPELNLEPCKYYLVLDIFLKTQLLWTPPTADSHQVNSSSAYAQAQI